MRSHSTRPVTRFYHVRPLIRYVDQQQAVIEVDITLSQTLADIPTPSSNGHLQAVLQVRSSDGFEDEQAFDLDHRKPLHMTIIQPERWWPAGLGGQTLYDLKVILLCDGLPIDTFNTTLGLTSVRRIEDNDPASLLVNGHEYRIDSVVTVDRIDENQLLPATGTSVLLVRDHYGTDLLYEAADRAGILLIQCVPLDPAGQPETWVAQQIDRLAHHPCLAGWFVAHQGGITTQLASRIRDIDPSHNIFDATQAPHFWAA